MAPRGDERGGGAPAHGARTGGYWMEALEQRLCGLEREAASLLLEAWLRSEEAEGVAGAVHLARSGEPWTPFDLRREEAASYGISLQRRPKLPLHAVLPPSRFNAPATGGERRTTMSR